MPKTNKPKVRFSTNTLKETTINPGKTPPPSPVEELPNIRLSTSSENYGEVVLNRISSVFTTQADENSHLKQENLSNNKEVNTLRVVPNNDFTFEDLQRFSVADLPPPEEHITDDLVIPPPIDFDLPPPILDFEILQFPEIMPPPPPHDDNIPIDLQTFNYEEHKYEELYSEIPTQIKLNTSTSMYNIDSDNSVHEPIIDINSGGSQHMYEEDKPNVEKSVPSDDNSNNRLANSKHIEIVTINDDLKVFHPQNPNILTKTTFSGDSNIPQKPKFDSGKLNVRPSLPKLNIPRNVDNVLNDSFVKRTFSQTTNTTTLSRTNSIIRAPVTPPPISEIMFGEIIPKKEERPAQKKIVRPQEPPPPTPVKQTPTSKKHMSKSTQELDFVDSIFKNYEILSHQKLLDSNEKVLSQRKLSQSDYNLRSPATFGSNFGDSSVNIQKTNYLHANLNESVTNKNVEIETNTEAHVTKVSFENKKVINHCNV